MLSFNNDFTSAVPAALQPAILQAEQNLSQLDAANDVINVTFDYAPLAAGVASQNSFNVVTGISYDQLKAALIAHAVTPDQQLAVANLPAVDPTNGAGFGMPVAYAQHLGLAPASADQGLVVTLNSTMDWSDPAVVTGAVEHELTEGGMGRVQSLGLLGAPQFAPLDLFRFSPEQDRDYSGGYAAFGLAPGMSTGLMFNTSGNGQDLADWVSITGWDGFNHANGDAFTTGASSPGTWLSPVDKLVLETLGYTPVSLPSDDFANAPGQGANGTFQTTTQTSGLHNPSSDGAWLATGSTDYLGDKDVFVAHLLPGLTYEIDVFSTGAVSPSMQLVNSAGVSVGNNGIGIGASNAAPGGNYAGLTFTVPNGDPGAPYYVEVSGQISSLVGTGPYSIIMAPYQSTLPSAVATSESAVLRADALDNHLQALTSQLAVGLGNGSITTAAADNQIVAAAAATSSVATLAYQYFTGSAPTTAGMDYLVSPTGPNPSNLNSAYYQSFSLENRYINFAVNLGRDGAGSDSFLNLHGGETLAQTLASAYQAIFGTAPSADKISHILNDTVVSGGQSMTRADYFAYYGGDTLIGIGTKAAMVGWLLSEAVKADVGTYALSNDAFLHDVATGANTFGSTAGVDLIGHYAQASFAYTGG